MRTRTILTTRATAFLLGGLLLAGCRAAGPAPPPGAGAESEPASYVGPRPCATCHASLAKGFSLTGMGRAFYDVSRLFAPPGEGSKVRPRVPDMVEIPHQALRYSVFSREGRLFMKQYRLDPRGREVNVDLREALYVLGSGNHSQSFITASGGRLYQMPLCWYPEAQLWDLCPGYETYNQYFQREVDDTCLFCHNGRVVRTGGFDNLFVEPIAQGIDCERCHGPGSRHVARWSGASAEDQAGWAAGRDEPDPTIVNPRRLPPDLGLQVCLQCHLGDSAQTERVMRREDHLDGFRPGARLWDFLAVHRFRQSLPGRFGLGAQADRLALSRCFTRTPEGIQCTLCHDPHVEVYDLRAAGSDPFDAACRSCHAAHDCPMRRGEDEGGCVGCHMRRGEPHDQRFTTFTDHWIRRRPEDGLDRARTDFRMEPFPGGEAPGAPAERLLNLGRAQLYKKTSHPDAASMPWESVFAPLQEAAAADPADARPLFYLGKAEVARGRFSEAAAFFRRAVAIDPRRVEAWQELGSAFLEGGAPGEALEALERALAEGPRGDDRGAVLNEIARAEMQMGRLDRAGERLREALEAEPLGVEVKANLGVLAMLRHDLGGAIGWFREAQALAPNRAVLRLYVADALSREGPHQDLDQAVAEARTAVALSPGSAAAREKLMRICRAAGRTRCEEERPGRAE